MKLHDRLFCYIFENSFEKCIFALRKLEIEQHMLIIDVKEGESIDRALKKYKRKFDRSGVLKEIRRRKHFTKPSVERRTELLKAEYRLQKYGSQ